jgi:hypothetical protein
VTAITIELTDEMVTKLRDWLRQPAEPGRSSFHITDVVATLVGNKLPAPDRTVAVTLPQSVVDVLGSLDPEYRSLYKALESDGMVAEAEALRAIVRSLAGQQ